MKVFSTFVFLYNGSQNYYFFHYKILPIIIYLLILYQRRICLTLCLLIKNECGSTFLSSALQYPKEHCFFEGSQPSSAFPTGKSSLKKNMCKEHWCNDTKRGRQTIYEQKAAANNA